MADNRRVVVGVFPTRKDAEQALDALRAAGFAGEDVSLLTQNPDEVVAPEPATPATSGATAGAFAGGLTGAFAGWLIGGASLLIPGVGPFIAAGAIASALTGAALGAGIGAIGGALTGLGIPEDEARWYEQQVQGGSTLLTVAAAGRAAEAEQILRRHRGRDVRRRDAEQVGYGVAGGSSSMELQEHDVTTDDSREGVETATRAFPATPAVPAPAPAATEPTSAVPTAGEPPRS